ncbi:NB-ARC domain-containing protein [Leptothoe sp. EHU-05/26/07-4]
MPRHYVQRPEHFEAIKAMLLDESTPGTLVISAIYGMGGIGKSVLAAALVQNGEIQQQFPDGVLWVTLGQQPDMLSMVNLWIRQLGDNDYNPTTLQAASLHLRTLLADKKALLVIDDVWHPEHVEPFRIRGVGCHVLVTTRQTKIIDSERYDLDLMTPQQSLELLTRCLPTSLSDAEKSSAVTFAKEVGYLPLALELAAAQIKDGVTWDELLTAFQSEMAHPEALDIDSDVASLSNEAIQKRRSLVASFKLTLKLLSREQLKQFAWLGIVPEDVSLTQPMAATLWGVSPVQASKLLREFKNRALLLSQAQRSGEKPTYRIHDLVHDLAKNLLTHEQYLGDLPGLGLTVEEAHSQFLERYRVQTQNDLWHTVPADGYIHSHLAWHFEQAGQPELMHQLLKESTPDGRNGWYEACEKLGQTASFVTDVARAWQAAEGLYDQNATESIALQCRYALITTSLNSLSQNLSPALIALFIQEGVWQPAQGLTYVKHMNPWQRVDSLTELLPYLSKAQISEFWDLVYSLRPQQIQYKSRNLIKLLPYLSKAQISEFWNLICSLQPQQIQLKVISEIASSCPKSQLSKALTMACSMQSESNRTDALSGLVKYLQQLVSETFAAACLSQDEWNQGEILRALAPYLSAAQLNTAWKLTCSMQSKWSQVGTLSALVPHLSEVQLSQALTMACSIQDESDRAKVLSALVPHLSEVQLSQALTMACSIQDESDRAYALIGIAKYLPEVVSEALEVTRSIQNEFDRVSAIRELAPYLSEAQLSQALALARMIQDESDRAYALIGIAKYLPEVVSEALEVTRSIQNEFDRVSAIRELAPYLSEAQLSQALALARMIQDESNRAYALIGIAKYLPEVVSEALEVTRSLHNESERYSAIRELAQYLSETQLSQALALARSLHNESERYSAIRELAQYLSETQLSQALALARLIKDEPDRANALSAIATYLPELVSEALTVTRSIQKDSDRAKALSALVPYQPELVNEVLSLLLSMKYEADLLNRLDRQTNDLDWANALSMIAPYLSNFQMSKALTIAHSIQYGYARAIALHKLAPYLSKSQMNEALNLAYSIKNDSDRANALSALVPYQPELVNEVLLLARSIDGELWRINAMIGLAPYLPELVNEVLILIRSMEYENERAIALSMTSPYMSETEMSKELARARSMESEHSLVKVLSALVENLPESLLHEAFNIVCLMQDEFTQVEALSELLPKLTIIETDFTVWQEVLHTLSHRDRKSFLEDIPNLAPAMISLSGGDKTVLNLVVEAMRDVCRQWP